MIKTQSNLGANFHQFFKSDEIFHKDNSALISKNNLDSDYRRACSHLHCTEVSLFAQRHFNQQAQHF